MFHLLRHWDTDSDALVIAGFAGGFLGMVCLGTGRGGLFGASVCVVSAALCITRTANRSDDRVRSLESAIEVCVADLAMLDGRFNELHDDTAVIATRVDWVVENAGVPPVAQHIYIYIYMCIHM